MRLETGSEALRRALQGRLPPAACLITGPGREALARTMAAALVCTASKDPDQVPCLRCAACRRTLEGHHPDVTEAFPDPKKNRYLIENVREWRADAWVRPHEAERKVYLFHDVRKMPPLSQNVLLKVLEEGPPYAHFLLLADSPEAVLPTIRSRCVRFTAASAEEAGPSPEAAEAAEDFFRRLTEKDELRLIAWAAALESDKLSRDLMRDILLALLDRLHRALREETPLTDRQLLAVIALAETLAEQCDYNLGAAHCAGRLAAACWEVLHE
ncbi:MAG: hypothetical protein IKD96_01355 [Oscillospiraceae bacterium]|nr:hypothetical protein [Oscillospiraceae bacterium]